MPASLVLSAHGTLDVAGPITFDNVAAVTARGTALLGRGERVVDLARVTEVDSSAVSMLLEWSRSARRPGCRVRFANVPPALRGLAQLYGVSELILEA